MKLNDILNGLTILETTADLNADITDVCYDSRQAVEGGLFVAIAGAATDGHRYIPMVQKRALPAWSASRRRTAASPMCWWRTPAGRWRSSPATGLTTPPGR